MYLIIFEGDPPKTAESITDSEKQASDDGYLEIIDISDSKSPKRFDRNVWHELDAWISE